MVDQLPGSGAIVTKVDRSKMDFRAGSKFQSFADFERAFEEWKTRHYHPFRVASSETLRMPDGSTNSVFKYRYIVYHCAHYGAPRMRGAGKRPNQCYLPCGCRAMLRLNFSWSENALRITTLNDVHMGHSVSQEAFLKFTTKVRRSSPVPSRNVSLISGTNVNASLPDSTTAGTVPKEGFMPPAIAPPIPHTAIKQENSVRLEEQENTLKLTAQRPSAFTFLPSIKEAALTPLFHQSMPLDLTVDKRNDEQRFQLMHPVLQSLTDHLMACKGQDFDRKLRQLKVTRRSWDLC